MGNEKEHKHKDNTTAKVKGHSEKTDSKTEARNKRKRTKFLTAQIRDQLVFYFSDANLRKDRFLKAHIDKSKDGLVDVSILLNFNKLKSMTDDAKVVIRAAKTSTELKVSSDESKIGRVRPLTPPKYNIDDVTVYVECIPPDTTHEWLKSVFSCCGKVAYVSIPRYKSSNDIKGFAFVEFETPAEAAKACQMLNNPQDTVARPGKFPKTRAGRAITTPHQIVGETTQNKPILDKDKHDSFKARGDNQKLNEKSTDEKKDEKTGGDGEDKRKEKTEQQQGKKRKRQDSEGEIQVHAQKEDTTLKTTEKVELDSHSGLQTKKTKPEKPQKQSKVTEETDKPKKTEKTESSDVKHRTSHVEHDKKDDSEVGVHKEHDSVGKESQHETHSHGKHHKHKRHHHDDSDDELEDDVSEKKRSRKHEHEHSTHDRKRKHTDDLDRDEKKRKKVDFEDEGDRDTSSKRRRKRNKQKMKLKDKMELPKLRVLPKKEWLELRKEYLQLQKANMAQLKKDMAAITSNGSRDEKAATDDKNRPAEIPFTKGVVIKFSSNKAIATKRILRELLASVAPIAYLDMKDGDDAGHVRFQTPEGALQVVEQFGVAGQDSKLFTTLLTGEEENQYWEKMNADRNAKLSSGRTTKRAKKKGLEKVLSKASRLASTSAAPVSHIRFDDDD